MSRPLPPRGLKRTRVNFRLAGPEDLEAMMEMVRGAQASLKALGVDQWQNGYPNEETLLADMEAGAARVMTLDSQPVGMLTLLPGPDPTYAKIDGAWLNDEPYMVIHRMAVHPELRRGGIASRMLREAEKAARKVGIDVLRIDTHEGNLPMNSCLRHNGFTRCGIIWLADGAERAAYQKNLNMELEA